MGILKTHNNSLCSMFHENSHVKYQIASDSGDAGQASYLLFGLYVLNDTYISPELSSYINDQNIK